MVTSMKDMLDLKAHKYTVGKDAYYEERRPIVWQNAQDVIAEYNKVMAEDAKKDPFGPGITNYL